MQVIKSPSRIAFMRVVPVCVLLLSGACRKEPQTLRGALVKGVWVLSSYSVTQTGGGAAPWGSSYEGDTRDYLDFHEDGTLESGDAWNGKRRGSFELRGDQDLQMLISSRAGTVSVRITEAGENSLAFSEEFKTGSRDVMNRYFYRRR